MADDSKNKALAKTKKQAKLDTKEAWKNRHSDPNYKGVRAGYLGKDFKGIEKKKVPDWAGDIGRKHMRNQKAETDKGYREDYR